MLYWEGLRGGNDDRASERALRRDDEKRPQVNLEGGGQCGYFRITIMLGWWGGLFMPWWWMGHVGVDGWWVVSLCNSCQRTYYGHIVSKVIC